MLTKGAIGNLVNRYRAVLKKCNLINTFGSLAVASLLILGGAGVAEAEMTYNNSNYVDEFDATNQGAIVITNANVDHFYGDGNVTLENGSIKYFHGSAVNGGNSTHTTVDGNVVNLDGGTIVFEAYGAHARGEKGVILSNNTLNINDGKHREAFYGASSAMTGYDVRSGNVSATGNVVNLNGGTIWGYANGDDTAYHKMFPEIYGAYVQSRNDNATTLGVVRADGNTVNINGGTILGNLKIYGGDAYCDLYSGNFTDAENKIGASASENKINISTGTVYQVYGGRVKFRDTNAKVNNIKAAASGNIISISGGEITNSVYGGYATLQTSKGVPGSYAIELTDNTVILSGTPILDKATIYGADYAYKDALNSDHIDVRSGNTLRVENVGLIALNVKNFENYDFVLPNTVKAGDVALTLTDAAGTDLGEDPKVGVVIMAGGTPLKEGDRVDLIRNEAGVTVTGTITEDNSRITATQGVSLEYDFEVKTDAKNLYAEVAAPEVPVEPDIPTDPDTPTEPAVRVNPQTKSLSEGRVAGLAFVNQGSDLIAERGITAARNASKEGGLVPFMAAQGGKSRYDTGSHIDVNGFSLMAGLALTKQTEIGDAMVAAFFESGWGSYDAHNSFSNASSVDAYGDNNYYGGGLLARVDFADFGPGHVYTEASLRAGWAETDYFSSDLRDGFGNSASYDSGSAYYGAHLGFGYEWKLDETSVLDFYAKYFWTHQGSNNVSVVGDPIRFDSADSHRARFGTRYEREFTTSGMVFTPFIGVAYEYEFDGEVAGTAYDLAIDKPELKGGTGIGELGVTFQPSEGSAFALDLGVQGYTGTREGVTGSFTLKYKF